MTYATYVLGNTLSAAVGGAIGAWAGEKADHHPILRGAAVTGIVGGTMAVVGSLIAASKQPQQVGTSGPPRRLVARFP